jgi:hypothetical protein
MLRATPRCGDPSFEGDYNVESYDVTALQMLRPLVSGVITTALADQALAGSMWRPLF